VLNPQIAVREATCTGLVCRSHNWPADTNNTIAVKNNTNNRSAKVNTQTNDNAAIDTDTKGTTDTTTTTNHNDLFKATKDGHPFALEDEAQCLVGTTSEKFVPEPMGEDITVDLINGLHRFKDAAKWKVFFKLLQEEKSEENQSNSNVANTTQEEKQEQQPCTQG